ncbi:hypothetical protein BK126_08980 [Paenibacillus sp. FSL H7-0326]|nr:hypothetical protein BK126_08980 [Paenibacillus sp. FSL H7-0326]
MKETDWHSRSTTDTSCVTITMVIPISLLTCSSSSSTPPVVFGSSADVGSSQSSTWGLFASALAMATRCFCPPLS